MFRSLVKIECVVDAVRSWSMHWLPRDISALKLFNIEDHHMVAEEISHDRS